MKKRRQLDALVGNGKSRRKSKSGHELLRSNADTDSSDLDHFSVDSDNPRLRNHRNPSFCSICSTVIGFCLLAACIIACAGLIWMHLQLKRDIAALQDQMKSVETKNKLCSEENQKVSGDIQILNKSLQELKTGKIVANEKNIMKLRNEIEGLKASSKSQQSSMTEAELDNFNAEFTTLKKTVAKLGSDVTVTTGWKNQAQASLDQIKARLNQEVDELNLKIKKVEVKSLTDSIQKMNTTFETSYKSLSADVERNKDKIEEIERSNKTIMTLINGLSKDGIHVDNSNKNSINTTDLKNNMKMELENWLQKLLVNETQQSLETKEVVAGINSRIENVTDAIELLWNEIHELKKGSNITEIPATSQDSYITTVTFHTFSMNVFKEIQRMNETSGQLRLDLTALQKRVDSSKVELFNLTKKVTKFAEFMLTNKTTTEVLSTKEVSPPTTAATTMTATTSSTAKTTEKLSTTTSGKVESSTLAFPSIESWEDLQVAFKIWDIKKEGKVSYKAIADDLTFAGLPTETQLSKFDTDKDNMYSMEELENALGFHPPVTKPLPPKI